MLSQPHQTVQPVMYRRPLGCACIECAPRVSFSNPLEDVQVAAADTQEPVQIAQASFFLQPLHDFQSSIPTCLGTRPLTPRASFLPQKLQHFIVAYLRSTHAENLWVTKQTIRIERVFVILSELTFNRKLKEPFEHVHVSILHSPVCCLVVNTLVSVVPEPFQYIQTAHRCGLVLPVQESTCISLHFMSTGRRRDAQPRWY